MRRPRVAPEVTHAKSLRGGKQTGGQNGYNCGSIGSIQGIDALASACTWADRDDVDIEPAIRLDTLHQTPSGSPERDAAGRPGDLHHSHCPADLLFARAR